MECFYFLVVRFRVDCFVFFGFALALAHIYCFSYLIAMFFFSFHFFMLISGEAEKVKTLIRLRAELSPLFTGKRNASKYAWA